MDDSTTPTPAAGADDGAPVAPAGESDALEGGSAPAWLLILGLAVLLLLSGAAASELNMPHGFASPVWPPSGVLLAGLLCFGRRALPLCFVAWLSVALQSLAPVIEAPGALLAASLLLTVCSCASYLLSALLLRRFMRGSIALIRPRELLAFVLCGACLGPILASLGGSLCLILVLSLPLESAPFTWLTWWVGDAIGVLIFTPVCLSVCAEESVWRHRRRAVTLPLLATFALVVAFFLYSSSSHATRQAAALAAQGEHFAHELQRSLGAEVEYLHALTEVYRSTPLSEERPFRHLVEHRLAERRVLVGAVWIADERPDSAAEALATTWSASREPGALARGRAIASEPELVRALERARITRDLVTTGMCGDLLGHGDEPVMWLLLPLPAAAGAGLAPPRGYFGLALSVPALLAPLRRAAEAAGLWAWIDDHAAATGDAPPARYWIAPAEGEGASELASGGIAERLFAVGTHTWNLAVARSPTQERSSSGFRMWRAFAVGLALVGILGMFLLTLSGRRAFIETHVAERTAALREANEVLALEIEGRLQELSSLERAAEAAEAANRAKSRFLNNMSHEMRTPLNAVIGMTELLIDTELDDEQREYAEVVTEAGVALLALIDDVLDVARIESGTMTLEEAPFSLRAAIGGGMSLLDARACEAGLRFASEVAEDVPDLLIGDAGRLRQVLLNLVNNAIKFTEQGGVDLAVARAAEESEAPGDGSVVLRFSVRDTGIGVPEDKQAVIFKVFEQADMSLSRRYGGTGLGLPIAVELVQLMGGELALESEPERGSVFSFTARFRTEG